MSVYICVLVNLEAPLKIRGASVPFLPFTNSRWEKNERKYPVIAQHWSRTGWGAESTDPCWSSAAVELPPSDLVYPQSSAQRQSCCCPLPPPLCWGHRHLDHLQDASGEMQWDFFEQWGINRRWPCTTTNHCHLCLVPRPSCGLDWGTSARHTKYHWYQIK